jgi:hypothetical protein
MKLLSIIFIFVFSATAFGQGGMVFADKKNKVYYAAGCREIADIAQIDMVSFFTTKAAQRKDSPVPINATDAE